MISKLLCVNLSLNRVDWELRSGFKPVISTVGKMFEVKYVVEQNPNLQEDLMQETFILILNALPFDPTSQIPSVISFHQPKIQLEPIEEKSFYVIHYSFDSFPRAGFYDWKIVRI